MGHLAELQRQEPRYLWTAVALGHTMVPLWKRLGEKSCCVPILPPSRLSPKGEEEGK